MEYWEIIKEATNNAITDIGQDATLVVDDVEYTIKLLLTAITQATREDRKICIEENTMSARFKLPDEISSLKKFDKIILPNEEVWSIENIISGHQNQVRCTIVKDQNRAVGNPGYRRG